MGIFYGVGIIFSASAILILLNDLYRVVTGKVKDEELVMVKENEEMEELEEMKKELEEQERHAHPDQKA
jgi:TRAP-type C4-dicarboxylate transport system permease small subunit